jgi:uncharacterized membrane protein
MAWMIETSFAHVPVVFYGVVLLICGLSFRFLTYQLSKHHAVDSWLTVSKNGLLKKETLSQTLHITAITIVPFISPTLSVLICFTVAVMWIFPSTTAEVA